MSSAAKGWMLIAAIVAGLAIVAFQLFTPIATVRYRLTLEAEVDGKPATGSGVIEVTYAKAAGLLSPGDYGASVRGEAVALDLGDKGTLFALLKEGQDSRSAPDYIVLRAFNFSGGALPRPADDGIRQVGRLSGKVELPLKSLPLLVRFRDINDPLTVEKLDPFNLEASFGSGVRLNRATMEIVSAGLWPLSIFRFVGTPISTGIEKRLSWLPNYYDKRLDGRRFGTIESSMRLANSLSAGAFAAGR